MSVATVYVVKFDRGYYAEKQPQYHWSFTDDVELAKHYKKEKLAVERGDWGVQLMNNPLQSYEIEQYEIVTVMHKL